MPWAIQHAIFTINRYLIRQDGQTSYERAFNNFGSRSVIASRSKASASCSTSEAVIHLAWECIITGKHIVARCQILKTYTATCLIKEQRFKAIQFSKVTLPPRECEPEYQEPQEDRQALQDPLRTFVMQQKSMMFSKTSKSQWITPQES